MPAARTCAASRKIVVQPRAIEIGHKHRRRRGHFGDQSQLFQCRQQPVQSQRRADAGQLLTGIKFGKIVVAPTRANAADRGQPIERRFDRSCRCNNRALGRLPARSARAPVERRPRSPRPRVRPAWRSLPARWGLPTLSRSSCSSTGNWVRGSRPIAARSPPPRAIRRRSPFLAATRSRPILASLSIARRIGVARSARSSRSSSPVSTRRLLTWIVKSSIPRRASSRGSPARFRYRPPATACRSYRSRTA